MKQNQAEQSQTTVQSKPKKRVWLRVLIVIAVPVILFSCCFGGGILFLWQQRNSAVEDARQADKLLKEAKSDYKECKKLLFPEKDIKDEDSDKAVKKVKDRASKGSAKVGKAEKKLQAMRKLYVGKSYKKYAKLRLKACDKLAKGFDLMTKERNLVKTAMAIDKLSASEENHDSGLDKMNNAIDHANNDNMAAAKAEAEQAQQELTKAKNLVEGAYALDNSVNLTELIKVINNRLEASSIAVQMGTVGKENPSRYNSLVDKANALNQEANALHDKVENSELWLIASYGDKPGEAKRKAERFFDEAEKTEKSAATLWKRKIKIKLKSKKN